MRKKKLREKSMECHNDKKMRERKVKKVPQSQAAAHLRHEKEEEKKQNQQAQIEQTYQSTMTSSVFPERGNRNAKRTDRYNNKITQGKICNRSAFHTFVRFLLVWFCLFPLPLCA